MIDAMELAVSIDKHSSTLVDITLRWVTLTRHRWTDFVSRIQKDLGHLNMNLHGSWLTDEFDPRSNIIHYLFLLYDENGFANCRSCRGNAREFNMHECRHISKTLHLNEVDLLQCVKRLDWTGFQLRSEEVDEE